jgi:hypothetical protein
MQGFILRLLNSSITESEIIDIDALEEVSGTCINDDDFIDEELTPSTIAGLPRRRSNALVAVSISLCEAEGELETVTADHIKKKLYKAIKIWTMQYMTIQQKSLIHSARSA